MVRGGNVLGEEAFFNPDPVYKESAVGHSADVGLLAVDASMLHGLGSNNFQDKRQNMLKFQRDFKSLFEALKEIHELKEMWRERANGMMDKQYADQQARKGAAGGAGASATNPLGDEFTEFRPKNNVEFGATNAFINK